MKVKVSIHIIDKEREAGIMAWVEKRFVNIYKGLVLRITYFTFICFPISLC